MTFENSVYEEDGSLMVLTCFEHGDSWSQLREDLGKEDEMGFKAYLDIVDDRRYDGFSVVQLLQTSLAKQRLIAYDAFFVVDELALTHPEHPILCINVAFQFVPERDQFRVIPAELWAVENNLSIANMGFEEFRDHADEDGIFRGFD